MPMMTLFARIPGLASFMRWRTRRDPLRSALRSIRDPDLAARTLADAQAAPLLLALLSGVFERLRERLPGTLNDMDDLRAPRRYRGRRIAAPLLIVHGDADRVVPFAHASRLADEAPNAMLMRIAAGEHVCLFTHMRAIRERVASFVAA